ncbi:hypothetical protein [Clostridium perfringens]|uniref:hypothetical protein n=1 Tax=Clostridium perfringens TaxID=1502 RepID=UPI002ACBF195|nr:hypothetical protein [Clostridium perfringens]
MGFLIGVILTIIGIFFSYDIAALLGADEYVNPLAGMYLKTIKLNIGASPVANAAPNIPSFNGNIKT